MREQLSTLLRQGIEQLSGSILGGAHRGNGFSDGQIKFGNRRPIFSQAKLGAVVDGEGEDSFQGKISKHNDRNFRTFGQINEFKKNA